MNGQKQGGNVASYFMLPDGRVLHVVAGPVNAATLLREARWVVETRKLAVMTAQGNDAKYKASWRHSHAERLQAEHGIAMSVNKESRNTGKGKSYFLSSGFPHSSHSSPNLQLRSGLPAQAKIHTLLANAPLIGIDKIYREVFERVLQQKTSNLPVDGEMSVQARAPMAQASVRFRQPVVADSALADLQPLKETTAEEKSANEERTASRRLRLAVLLVNDAKNAKNRSRDSHDARASDHLLDLASSHFREIAHDYPNTLAAGEARRLLGEE
ncbi:MAG TPA: hypothetical protein VGX70_22160 [Gemmataceae bacterium]|nr:hypothetical protein [Gemmataceae bacterium]